jgi:tripartite-type tricarboxylate transporter receptor subunit TctC
MACCTITRSVSMGVAFLLLAALPTQSHAQQPYPNRALRLVVPLAPGGPSDILARTISAAITGPLGHPVVVDNRPGAGGITGADIVAKSPADGYTLLLMGMSTYTSIAALYPKLPYDARRDLTPVTALAASPFLLVVHPALPVKSLKEFIALAKARPGELNYASGGVGTQPQMLMEIVKLAAGVNLTHIPYKGTGPALTDTLAGHVQTGMFGILAALPSVQSGRLRVLAVSDDKRAGRLPNVPTLIEAGLPGVKDIAAHMIFVPTATPREIVTRLNREMVAALQTAEVKSRLANEGADVVGNSADQAAAMLRADLDQRVEIVKRANIRLD